MAFLKTAHGVLVHRNFSPEGWGNFVGDNKSKLANGPYRTASGSPNLVAQASEILGQEFDPSRHLLSHCTIVASVDTEEVPNVKIGNVRELGQQINRKWSNYRITPETEGWINNNGDSWDRPVLLKSYRTFVGAHNFLEHLQVEEMSKGRIIDAVARDIGSSIYVDILVATDRRHASLIRDIESGKLGTLSMGCFLAGTQVTMANGTRVAIEDVVPGDMVVTHRGRSREVLNKQIRSYRGELRYIKAVGVSSTIRATANHGFEVLRPPTICACGCGESLPTTSTHTRRMTRRFKTGHDKRVFNPNNTYSLEEARRRREQMDDIQSFKFEKVRADELEVGDFLCFPRAAFEGAGEGWTRGKARLVGYFLAEGSFLKRAGNPVEVQFNFSMTEKDTFVREVVELLQTEFPQANTPWTQDRPERDTCVVHMTGREVADWFLRHCGEYSHAKRMSHEVMALPDELHREIVGAWINGDGTFGDANKTLSGTTVSYDLGCQMHLLLARCGLLARLECSQNGRSIEISEAVGAGWTPDPETGKRPALTLVMGLTSSSTLSDVCAKVGRETQAEQQLRVTDDHIIFPITSIESDWYEGPVHNMEVQEDHTYLVEGVAVHNCSVTDTICTKCGNVAADETEMCFPPGTRVLLADGRYVPIEEIVEGDVVVTHTGDAHAVTETMQRQYDGHLVSLDVEGVPVGLRSTPNHPYWTLRPAQACACGCGEKLRRTVEHDRGSVKAFQRRFLPGHNTRLRNPNPHAANVVEMGDYERLFDVDLEFVAAGELKPGDYLAFPIPQETENTDDATVNRGRLIGYFLAEGSFIKRDGERVGVSFTFGHHEHDTLAAEVESLLNEEFGREERRVSSEDWRTLVARDGVAPVKRRSTSRPVPADVTCPACGAPSAYAYNVRFKKGADDCYQCKVCDRNWVDGADRSVRAHRNRNSGGTENSGSVDVRFMDAEVAEFFFRYCGEYSHEKRLDASVLRWASEVQKHVLFGWLGGDATQAEIGIVGSTASFNLLSQMHILAARCGLYSYKKVTFGGRSATLDQVVNGDGSVTVRDHRGWLPSFGLVVSDPRGFGDEVRFTDREVARVTMSAVTDGFKRVGNWLIYRVRGVSCEQYSGPVHNFEVERDHSYVVEGLAVHNCEHVKYEKNNIFFDERGTRRKVAELCGHDTLDPTGGVTFIEASWVAVPAFPGAVMRNILEADQVSANARERARAVLASPPPEWVRDPDGDHRKAARVETPAVTRTLVTDDASGTGRTAQFPPMPGAEEGAPGAPGGAEDKDPMEDLEEKVMKTILERVQKKIEEKLRDDEEEDDESPAELATSTNENINHQAAQRRRAALVGGAEALLRIARSDVELLEGLARLNASHGVKVSRDLYRAVLRVGSTDGQPSLERYLRLCAEVLGRKPTTGEAKTMVRLGRILSLRKKTRF